MKRKIVSYHTDDKRDWVAELECGHHQHVRHNPPWMNRPWVESNEGRDAMLGFELNCRKCDAGEPADKAPETAVARGVTAMEVASMTNSMQQTRYNIRRWTIILGVLQITIGCLVGFIPPTAVQWFRGIVMAHIEFTANGVLMIVFGFLVNEMNLKSAALKVWFVTLQIGTWSNGAAGVAAAFIGATSKLMPTISEKFLPPHGTDSPIVTGALILCGFTITVALLLTLYGLLQSRSTANTIESV